MSFPIFSFTVITLARFSDLIDLDDMVNKVQNILGSKGCKEQSQVNFLNSGSSNPKESQLTAKICIGVDVV
jgi:hypothetical protein